MEAKVAGLLGAVAALGTITSAQAAPANALHVNSYAELLEPLPNASALLRAMDEQPGAESPEGVQPAQFYYHHHHHHHHHHHWGPGVVIRPPFGFGYYYHHHHHHHHHHYRYYSPY